MGCHEESHQLQPRAMLLSSLSTDASAQPIMEQPCLPLGLCLKILACIFRRAVVGFLLALLSNNASAAPHFEQVMMGTMVQASPTGTADPESVTATREYSGNQTAPTTSITQDNNTCAQTLATMEITNNVPSGESCTCPTGVTPPQCVSTADTSAACQTALQIVRRLRRSV